MTQTTGLEPPASQIKLAAPVLWPQNVPTVEDSITLMFDPSRLPEPLQQPALDLMKVLATQRLAEVPPMIDMERWRLALATVFRLQAASTLALEATTADEPSLQALFDEAADARDWLLDLTFDALFESAPQALALRGILQARWDEVLARAPLTELPAPQADTGKPAGVQVRPARPAKKADPPKTFRPSKPSGVNKTRVVLIAGVVASLGLLLVSGTGSTEVDTNGAPAGWVVAGTLDPGPATLMSVTTSPPPRAEINAYLDKLRSQGVEVVEHGPDEWLLTKLPEPSP